MKAYTLGQYVLCIARDLDSKCASLVQLSQGAYQRVSLDRVKEETTMSKAEIPSRHISLGD